INRRRTGKRAGHNMETSMRRRGQFLASRGSRRILVCDEFVDMDCSRLRTVCGQFVSAANACPRTVETVMRSRMRTVCDRACGRGLSADMDCSRTRINRVRGLFPTGLRSWTCQGSGHGTEISRGRSACLPRLIRGRRSLVRSRGNAYIILNMVRNTVPPRLLQLVTPAFQLGHYGLEASDLFDGLPFDPNGIVVTQSRGRQLHQGVGTVVINALFELLQHLDRSAQLSGCRCLHGQTWMPCECLRVEDCRRALFL